MKRNSLETFRAAIAAGHCARGLVITSTDTAVTELAADCGCDFVWIDLEHSPLTVVDAARHVAVLRGSTCAPLIRVGDALPHLLKPVLDLAPAGVILPMINTAAAARRAVSLCRYPNDGGERGMALRSNNCYGRMPVPEYLAHSAREPLVIIQIEHRDAVGNLDEILSVPGIDSVCIGPCDLSASYGKPGDFFDPEIAAAIDLVREKVFAAGLLCGGFCAGPFWADRPMHWRAIGDDTGLLASALRERLKSD